MKLLLGGFPSVQDPGSNNLSIDFFFLWNHLNIWAQTKIQSLLPEALLVFVFHCGLGQTRTGVHIASVHIYFGPYIWLQLKQVTSQVNFFFTWEKNNLP